MKLYVYNHCPYCVRVLLVLGLKNIVCSVEHFLNDDIDGPVGLVGVKQVPILEKDDGGFMVESLDIVNYLDDLHGQRLFAPASGRKDLDEWIGSTQMVIRQLMMPRWVQFDEHEFATQGAKDYFIKNKQAYVGDFGKNLAMSSELIIFMEERLAVLEGLFEEDLSFNKHFSLDDITLWSRLRGLTGIKNLNIPSKIKNYLDYYAEKAGISLYYNQQV